MTDKASELADLVHSGNGTGSAEEIAPGIYRSAGISNAYLLTTPEGNIAINAGMAFEGEQIKSRFASVSDAPLRTLIYTQSHPDHIGGTAVLCQPDTQIIAQADYHRVRRYWNDLGPFYGRRTQTLWGGVLGNPGGSPAQPADPEPDFLFLDRHELELGGRQLELIATPGGETTDSLVVWLPEERTVFIGNLCGPIFGHLPNLYTIRGDKIRSAVRLIESVDTVRALGAELLISGHGQPVRGSANIEAQLTRIRDAVQWIYDRTIAGMNAGDDLYTLMASIQLPDELNIGQGHGKVSWCVRAIWEEYAGWFQYRSTTELYPVPASAVYTDIVAVAGEKALNDRARAYVSSDKPLEALHITDIVLAVTPDDPSALKTRASALQRLIDRSGGENFSEVQWLKGRLEEAKAASAGR